jgi:excinuclease UvrABC nuclease subunit
MRYHLYKHYDANGTLLYIGQSTDALRRLYYHQINKSPWIDRVATVEIKHFNSKQAVDNAERCAILTEQPPYNRLHNECTPREQLRARAQSRLPKNRKPTTLDIAIATRETAHETNPRPSEQDIHRAHKALIKLYNAQTNKPENEE